MVRSNEPINTFRTEMSRIEILVELHVFNPYTNIVMDVMKNQHKITPLQDHSNSILPDVVDEDPRTCVSRDVGHQKGTILKNNQDPGKISKTIKRLSYIQSSKN